MKNLFFILFVSLSCKSDYQLQKDEIIPDISQQEDSPQETYAEDTVIEIEEPDIEIEFIPAGSLAVKPGCSTTGKFAVKNVGTAELIVNELNAYASIPADIQITSNYAPIPLMIQPGDEHYVDFIVNETDNIEDKIIVAVKSNDPDESIVYSDATYTSDMGMMHYEHFLIKENRSADVLMVVDNSCSMSEEQAELASNTHLFIDSLDAARIDYRIAVITTDDPKFVGPVITPRTWDPAMELSSQVNVGVSGYPLEMGIMMASKALSTTGMAAPGGSFLRSDARLSIVWISDENDFSGGTTYSWSSDFWSKKTSPGDVSVWSIIGDPIYGCDTALSGDKYYDLISAMGGNWSSICSTDWGTPMSAVAGRAGIDSTLELSGNPIPSSVRVMVGVVESFDWVYILSSNAVSFNPGHIPTVGTNITVKYNEYEACD